MRTLLLQTDIASNVVGEYGVAHRHHAFAAYGYVPGQFQGVLGFSGLWLDDGTQRYFSGNGYRIYSPVLMRFLSPDRFSPFGLGGLGAYAYCEGDPVNHFDPSGRGRKRPGSAVRIGTPTQQPTDAPFVLREGGEISKVFPSTNIHKAGEDHQTDLKVLAGSEMKGAVSGQFAVGERLSPEGERGVGLPSSVESSYMPQFTEQHQRKANSEVNDLERKNLDLRRREELRATLAMSHDAV